MENTSPPRKLPRVAAFGSPKFDHAGDDAIAERLDDIAERIDDAIGAANELADVQQRTSASSSPGSVFSDQEDLAEELRGILTRLKLRTEETRPASRDVERPSDISRDEIRTFEKEDVVDAMELVTFDNPTCWPPKLRKLYNRHREHNIKAVQEALGDGVVARRQAYDYFSLQADVLCVLDFPPEDQAGPLSALAFTLSELHSEKNDLSVLSVKSVCIRQHALAFCKAAGCYHEGYELVEKKGLDGSSSYIALTPHARDALQCDFIERHPTCIRNDVNLAQLISRSSLGRQHVVEGDKIFAAFVKARQEYVRSRNSSNGQGHKLAPVFVWNAGLARSGDERTGALAAQFVSLELAGVEELQGMHHPCFVFRKENLLVQLSAASYDRAVCDACRAAGRKVDDTSFWQRFVGVADMTPEERLVKEQECREFYSALGSLAWMSTGKPGSNKRAVYDEFVADMAEEHARHFAQAKVLFDGAVQAAARRLGISEDELETFTLEERQALVCSMTVARKEIVACASVGISEDDLMNMPRERLAEIVRKYDFRGKVKSALKWKNMSETDGASMSEQAQIELVEAHKQFSMLAAACEAFGENVETASKEWTDAERAELIQNYNSLRMCEELGFSKEEARQFSAEQRSKVKTTYTKKTLLRRLNISPSEENDDDNEAGLTYEAGMTMTLDELWSMIVMRDGGMTPQQSLRYTCALRLGLSKEQVDGLSQDDLDRARVYSLRRGIQKRNEQKGLFLLPGTEAHADVVSEIKSYFKVAGAGILTDLVNSWGFVNKWAFREHVRTSGSVNYNIYFQRDFHGIHVWESRMEELLRTLGRTRRPAIQTSGLSRGSISDYIFRRRVDLFSNELTRESLERMTTRIPFGHDSVAERAKLQRRIEKHDPEFSFPGQAIFDSYLEVLSADASATFRMPKKAKNSNAKENEDWTSSLCVQRKRYIRSDTGNERINYFLYYRDDWGAWYGPTVQWGLLAEEREKNTQSGNIVILNEIYARFCERREVDRELIAFEEELENTVFFYDE